jgi:ADP-sugar diphosphatase
VKENSDKEWKFSRYSLIVEYTSTSFHPPPFNIVVIPIKKAYYLFHKKTAIDYTELDMQEAITIKQREQFKNLMKDAKEDLLDDNAGEELNTLASVSEHVRENFKTLIDEQEIKYKSIDAKLTDLAAKTQAITINSGSGSGMASLSNDLKMEINHAQEVVNTAVKQEIATLQRNILEALKTAQAPPVETATVVVQNREIPVTWAPGVKSELIPRVLREYKPFQEWNTEISKPDNAAHLTVQSIHIQNIDQFGPRIGFVKFQAIVKNHAGQNVAGIVFMRGGSVGMLVVLRLDDPESPDHGKEYTIVTVQPRVPCGAARFTEIPAGMLDGGHFAGVAAKELREETGIDIQEEALIDLTGLAYNGNHRGMFPSAGGCDEVIGLFLYRTSVTREQLESYQDKLTGVAEENEVICLKVLPLDQLWLEAPDAKALAALYLYQALSAKGVIPTDY